jgi:hypothetical protein
LLGEDLAWNFSLVLTRRQVQLDYAQRYPRATSKPHLQIASYSSEAENDCVPRAYLFLEEATFFSREAQSEHGIQQLPAHTNIASQVSVHAKTDQHLLYTQKMPHRIAQHESSIPLAIEDISQISPDWEAAWARTHLKCIPWK